MTYLFERPEGSLAFDDTGGEGPLVVCVPGMGDLRAEYRFLTPVLTGHGFRVVTVDVRGHGESSVGWLDHSAAAIGSDVVALIRHLAAGPAIVVGESMAAASAVWAAAESPDVAAIVLCGPVVRDMPTNALARLALGVLGRSATAWVMVYANLYRSRKPDDFASYRRSLRKNLREPGRMAALRAMLTASKQECEDRLPRVHCPALIVMGTDDPDFADPTAEANSIADRLGGATVLLIAGAGHYPQTERPDEVAPTVVGFLAGARHA